MDRSEKLVTQRESTAFYCMKCFAILCVIAAHVNQYCGNSVLESVATRAWSHIAKYGVACFFILGGFFYQRTEHDGKRFWAKKFRTLVVPWVFCASLTFLITRRWVTEGNYFALPLNQILRDYLVWVSGYGTIYYFAAVFLFCQLVFKFLAKKDIYLYITVLASAAALILHEMGLSGGVDQLFLKDQLNPLYRMGLFSLGVLARKHRIDRALLQQKRLILLPLLMNPWLITLMENFVKAIPHEITESGKIDGAGDFRIFYALILPSLKPALATIGLFLALGYWNEWYYSSLVLSSKVVYRPLQYHLYNVINKVASLKNSVAGSNGVLTDLPGETLKMATATVATGPIILLYPFVQKYFVAGLTVGSVKG